MLNIGTRGSYLALTQTHWVRKQILDRFPDLEISIRVIRTSADEDQVTSLRQQPNTGVFVKEIEHALISREIDLAVHSMKDVPTVIPDPLEIGVVPVREDARDALIARSRIDRLDDLPEGAIVGTGSIRRQAQLLARRPDLQMGDIRGNVDTRLRKLKEGEFDAIILACAGLHRVGLQDEITLPLSFEYMLPAPGQGALALEIRKNDGRVFNYTSFLHHQPTALAVAAERQFLRRMGGGCNSPIAVHGRFERGLLHLEGLVSSADGREVLRNTCVHGPHQAEEAGDALASSLLGQGGKDLLKL